MRKPDQNPFINSEESKENKKPQKRELKRYVSKIPVKRTYEYPKELLLRIKKYVFDKSLENEKNNLPRISQNAVIIEALDFFLKAKNY